LSERQVRDVLDVLCGAVPWFVKIITVGECTSSQSTKKENGGNTKKENLRNGSRKQVEGLLIFGKRDGKEIGREDVLNEFRLKRQEWEKT
jgi:hypothetical protein